MSVALRVVLLFAAVSAACSASPEAFDPPTPAGAAEDDDPSKQDDAKDAAPSTDAVSADAATTDAGTPPAPRRVALFVGSGAGEEYTTAVTNVLSGDTRFVLTKFADGSVDLGKVDVVVMPGGTASTEWKTLGANGQSKLKTFVSGGGGYVGVCAGFYLALGSVAGFVPAEHYEPWARGEGQVDVNIVAGNPVFTTTGKHRFRFVNGPVLQPAQPGTTGYTVLATFGSNIGSASIVSMVGKPAVVASTYGKGRVVAFSPHPELSGLGGLLADAVVWAGTR